MSLSTDKEIKEGEIKLSIMKSFFSFVLWFEGEEASWELVYMSIVLVPRIPNQIHFLLLLPWICQFITYCFLKSSYFICHDFISSSLINTTNHKVCFGSIWGEAAQILICSIPATVLYNYATAALYKEVGLIHQNNYLSPNY